MSGLSPKSQDSFLKRLKENNQGAKKKPKGKVPACSTYRSTHCADQWKKSELLEPIPYEFIAYCTKRNKGPRMIF